MRFLEITVDKKRYIELLLLGDEQESMIDLYLERGTMFALYDGALKSICVVTQEDEQIYELKNIATYKSAQGKGYGSALVRYILERYKRFGGKMRVGTGEDPRTISFYEQCGFQRVYLVKNFFTDHYDHPIVENGRQLVDMIYLEKPL